MKLYHAPGSCSQAVHIVLQETGIHADLIQVDPRKHRLEDGTDYYAVNELGYVPFLQLDDGTCLREGPVISQYLADLRPDLNLAPAAGTMERYHLQEWLNFLTSEIHKGFIPLLYAIAAGKYVETARPKLKARFAWLNQHLERAPYLMGTAFTVADAYLFALIGWGKADWLHSVYNAEIDLTDFAHLKTWYGRVRARPAVYRVLQAEGFTV